MAFPSSSSIRTVVFSGALYCPLCNSGISSECNILTAPAMRMSSLGSRQVAAGSGAPPQLSPKLDVLAGFGFAPVAKVWCLASAKKSARDAVLPDRSSKSEAYKECTPWTMRTRHFWSKFSIVHKRPLRSSIDDVQRMPVRRQRGMTTAANVSMGMKYLLSLFGMALALAGPATGATSGGLSTSVGATGSSTLMIDLRAGAATFLGAVAYIEIFNVIAKRNILSKVLSRKLVHIGVGLIFMLFWPLYSTSSMAPYIAAFAPAANCLRIMAVGLGLIKDEYLVKSMTRHENHRELLQGPVFYGLSIVIATVYFWRTSVIGIVTIVTMCAGDGIADIVGRKHGKTKLPYNKIKSVAGSMSFFVFSSAMSILYLKYFAAFDLVNISEGIFGRVVLICLLSAVVESTPLSSTIDDNLLVPLTSSLLGMLMLP